MPGAQMHRAKRPNAAPALGPIGLSFPRNLGVMPASSRCLLAARPLHFPNGIAARDDHHRFPPMNTPPPSNLWQPSRREFLYVGLLGTVGLTMTDLFRAQARAASTGQLGPAAGKAKSVINIYLPGGMSH